MKTLSLLLLALPLFAAQDANITSAFTLANSSVPAQSGHCTLEGTLNSWPATPTATQWMSGSNACGILFELTPDGSGNAAIQSYWVLGAGDAGQFQVNIGSSGAQRPFRVQVDPIALTSTIDVWDENCAILGSAVETYTSFSGSNPNGLAITTADTSGTKFSWLRVSTDTFPAAGPCPTTAATGRTFIAHWKFDGTLLDSSGNGLTLACSGTCGGQPAYTATSTAFQNLVIAQACSVACAGQPAYESILPSGFLAPSWKASTTVTLDGSNSFSQTDASSQCSTYAWSMLAAPGSPMFSSTSAATPTLTGIVTTVNTIDYNPQLICTDAAANTGTASWHIGAVSEDASGVVITGNPIVDFLLGPMITWGLNPWGYADYWHFHAINYRHNQYASTSSSQGLTYPGWTTNQCNGSGPFKPQWECYGAGTIAYHWNCVGLFGVCNNAGPTVTLPISNTATSFTLSTCSGLDFSTSPTRLIVYDLSTVPPVWDDLSVDSCSGGTVTLSYDPGPRPRHTFPGGDVVRVIQGKVTGTGTHFLTDSNAAVCPVGAGLPGLSSYSTGTAGLTAGSNVMTSSGATFTMDSVTNNLQTPGPVEATNFVQVSATHSSTPFTFIAQNITGGAAANGTVVAGAITSVVPFFGQVGANFITGHVSLAITDPTGSGASVTPNIVAGQVTSYTVNAGGMNYANPTFTLTVDRLTLERVFPSTADTMTGLSYHIMPATRTAILHYTHWLDGAGDAQTGVGTTICTSETEFYTSPLGGTGTQGLGNSFFSGADIAALNGSAISGVHYSVTDTTGWVHTGVFGMINYYGEDIAEWAHYYRSGLKFSQDTAKSISNYWIKSPWANGDVQSVQGALYYGGGFIGAMISYTTDSSTTINEHDLRPYFNQGRLAVIGQHTQGCNAWAQDDTRDVGYLYMQLIMGAIYDPDTTSTSSPAGGSWRAYWQSYISGSNVDSAGMLANDTACQQTDSSWSNAFDFAPAVGPLTLTTNSKTVTGTGLSPTDPNGCNGTATGTGTVTHGVGTIAISTGSVPMGTTTLVITGTTGGGASVFSGSYAVQAGSSGTGTINIAVLWPGDSGTVDWMSTAAIGGFFSASGFGPQAASVVFANNTVQPFNDDPALNQHYACIWVNSTTLTLNRNWVDSTRSDYFLYSNTLAGREQQPFMVGIKSYGLNLLAKQTLPALSGFVNAYHSFTQATANWAKTTGIDPNNLSTFWSRANTFAEPDGTPSATLTDFRQSGSSYGLTQVGTTVGRTGNAEMMNAVVDSFIYSPTAPNKSFIDTVFGAVWGTTAYNTGGVFTDPYTNANHPGDSKLTDNDIQTGRWLGYYCGIGNCSGWAAVRTQGAPTFRPVFGSGVAGGGVQ